MKKHNLETYSKKNRSTYIKVFWAICSFILIVTLIPSCQDDKWTQEDDNKYINDWIYEAMSFYYFWNNEIPKNTDKTQYPTKYFESLLYKRNTLAGDRFSWIQPNYLELVNSLNGVSSDIGFEYYKTRLSNSQIVFLVAYVKQNSDAEKQGLKRGDIITAIDNKTINEDNESFILSTNLNNYKLSVSNYTDNTTKELNIKVNRSFAENPIYLSNTYEIDGKKIGYIVYNLFSSDSGNSSYEYDKKLADIFDQFNTSGVNYLILDLRYNPGGSVATCTNIASALVKNRNSDDVFISYLFNDQYAYLLEKEYGDRNMKEYFQDNITSNNTTIRNIPKLGDNLNHLYILTGTYTASASELLINGLKPYLGTNISTIGEKTTGKNMASLSIYKTYDPKNKWGLQPLVAKVANKENQSDYIEGIAPNIEISDFDSSLKLKQLGDVDEPLLANAIAEITGKDIIRQKSNIFVNKIGSSLDKKIENSIILLSNDKIIELDK